MRNDGENLTRFETFLLGMLFGGLLVFFISNESNENSVKRCVKSVSTVEAVAVCYGVEVKP